MHNISKMYRYCNIDMYKKHLEKALTNSVFIQKKYATKNLHGYWIDWPITLIKKFGQSD